MARQPIQVHVYLYRRRCGDFEYALFRRSDDAECWQGICGGLEDGETILDGAVRETFEEAGIDGALDFIKLESLSYLPDDVFSVRARKVWGDSVVVVPMHFFAAEFDGEVTLSHEHSEVRWLGYDDALPLIKYNDQKVALYELDQKLRRNIIK